MVFKTGIAVAFDTRTFWYILNPDVFVTFNVSGTTGAFISFFTEFSMLSFSGVLAGI